MELAERASNTSDISPKAFGTTTSTIRALLCDRHWRSDRGVFEKRPRHSFRQTNATMRCRKGRNIALVHRVAASEEHRIRHPGTIEMRPFRAGIFSHVDI